MLSLLVGFDVSSFFEPHIHTLHISLTLPNKQSLAVNGHMCVVAYTDKNGMNPGRDRCDQQYGKKKQRVVDTEMSIVSTFTLMHTKFHKNLSFVRASFFAIFFSFLLIVFVYCSCIDYWDGGVLRLAFDYN